MTKNKNTKRALLGSVLSMIVCLAMLIGSTFAWFTDSVVSGTNKIVAGNLDVELYHKNAKVNTEEKVDNLTNLFCDKEGNAIKWEPGVIAYENFTVKNVGNLALKYNLTVNVSDFNTVKVTENGEQVDKSLKDVLKVAILDGQHFTGARTEATSLFTSTSSSIVDFDQSGFLLAGTAGAPTTKDFAMVIYWQPTEKDNDFNINNGKTLTKKNEETKDELFIDLGVNLVATQKDSENDSFGNDYDEGLIPTTSGLQETYDDGTVVYHTNDGEVLLYDTQNVTGLTDGTYNIPEGVTTIGGYAFAYNDDIQKIVLPNSVTTLNNRAFRQTLASSIELNEGLTSIGYQVFRSASNLTNVNIPSTVTSIGKEAFQLSGLTTLTIPATVTSIDAGAFRDMPNLETLVIEGNPTIANYAARTCPKLKNVYLNGNDVTFTGTSQVFTHADSGEANGITIHVKNETVKAKVETAQGSAYGYTIVVE